MISLSNISQYKGLLALLFVITMGVVFMDSVAGNSFSIEEISTELTDMDAEKETDKNEKDTEEKKTGKEFYYLSSLRKDHSDGILINALSRAFYSQWCDPEREIITPPPEHLG